MKKFICISLLLILAQTIVNAQCAKKLLLTSSKTEYLDGSGVLQRSEDENSIIEISKSEVTIRPGDGNKWTGPIKSTSCAWKTPFKEGKTVIRAALTDPGGDTKNVMITIEGKDGKITLLVEVDEMPDKRIRVTLDKFEEKLS